jgi:glutamyl-tRNA(Gln) amidotransferase subunit E
MLKRNDFAVDEFSNHDLEEMLSLLKEGKINRDALLEIAKEKAGHPAAYVQDIAARIGKSMASDSDVRKIIAEIVSKNKALAKEKGQHAQGALMGDVMKSLRGKADGATISRILKEEIEKVSK